MDLADTNDIGNILSRMRRRKDFTFTNIDAALRIEGIVHEPTRIFYTKLAQLPLEGTHQWCKNCKNNVETDQFHTHWETCINTLRWCTECNVQIPLEKYAPHMEKHQIVMCIDCGQPIEWRNWETHRLGCTPMMREITTENEFLPEFTRKKSLELGVDKRDLHTMRFIKKGDLPKDRAAGLRKKGRL